MPRAFTLTAFLLTTAALLTTGCASPNKRLDTNTRQRIVTTTGLDVDDAIRAAAVMTESMLNSRVFAGGEPPIIEVSTFINNTETQIDPDSVLKKIRVELTNSGLARVFTPRGQDALAAEQSARTAFRNTTPTGQNNVQDNLRPDYTLSFKILDDRAKAGRIRELTYTFQMSLTEADTRIAAWEGEEVITKQGSKATVGW